MPYDGSGNYVPPSAPTFPAITGTTINSTYYNAVVNDISTALNNVITRDGQGKPSAAINWNAQNLTNVAAFSAASATLSAPLPIGSGGTGLATVPTNGQLLIGNGATYTLANITGGAGITVTNGSGTIQISAVGGGSVSSVDVSGGATGLTFSGGPITTAGTITMAGTLAIANGGTGSTTAANARTALSAAASGAVTASGITMTSARLLGRITAATGAIEEITAGATLLLSGGSLSVASVPTSVTFNDGGSGAVTGTTYNGATARTISWNTIGAQPSTPRKNTSTSAATLDPTFSDDIVERTTQTVNLTISAPTGTAIDGFGAVYRIKATAGSLTLAFNAIFRAVGVTLPTTLVNGKWLYIGVVYNATDTKWDVVGINKEA